ncbi:MAG: DNRLRE domain-containing protein [Bacteroidales bacterium]|nr:DNRLRE domain-containing protein [Bacteroidales bacterium]MDT8431932.1 DNRLRE domain-containing protein [Bacteroidales bacterium]
MMKYTSHFYPATLLTLIMVAVSMVVNAAIPSPLQTTGEDTDTVVEARFVLVDTLGGVGTSPGNTEPARILRDVPTNAPLDAYFGWKGLQLEATGHFRTEQIDGYWYLVDPLGHPFFSVAPNSVNSYYPNINMPEDLVAAGFNSLGNWSVYENINSFMGPDMPYVTRVNFMLSYKNTTQRLKDLYNKGVIGVFDPEFVTYAGNIADEVIPLADDPFCIGVFTDNELPNYDNTTYGVLLERFLDVHPSDPNYIAAHQWMLNRKGEGYTIDDTDREEFHGYVMGTYYRIVHAAIRAVAPDLLILGSRLHGAAKYKPSIFREAGKYVDVISVNFYGPYNPPMETLGMWLEESNKPFLISEFYAKAYDVGMPNASGAGNKVPTQTDRAIYFENFTLRMLETRGCVGVQWHRFQDDINPDVNKGFINENGTWYAPLKNSLGKITRDIYGLRNYLKPLPEDNQAMIYDTLNFLGTGTGLAAGDYSGTDLVTLGMQAGDIISVKLADGFKAVLYSNTDLTGDSLEVFTSDGYLNNNLEFAPASIRIIKDIRIIVDQPLGEIIVYKPVEREIELSEVFVLKGDESKELNYSIDYITPGAPFGATVEGSILNIVVEPGEAGEGIVVIRSELNALSAMDTLRIVLRELAWNAAVKDTYVRGGDYNGDNYGEDIEVLVKSSSSDNYTRIAFFGFDIDPLQLPASFNKVELMAGVNTRRSTVELGVFGIDDNSWGEMQLTWLSQPDLSGDPVSSLSVSSNNETVGCRWDVSDYVLPKTEAGEYTFSIAMKALESATDPAYIDAVESGEQFAKLAFSLVENTDLKTAPGVEIYPNPAGDFLHFRSKEFQSLPGRVEILSADGHKVMQLGMSALNNGPVDISQLPEGLYFIRVTGTSGNFTTKFIKTTQI